MITDLVVAIDPDAQRSGVAIWENGQLSRLEMWAFSDVLGGLQEAADYARAGAKAVFVLEDVEAIRPTFKRQKTSQAAMQKISQNVGQVKQTARLIKEMAEHYGVELVMVRPLGGLAKSAKNKPELFKQITGWTGRSNADTRDAAMLGLHYIRGQQRRIG